MNIFDLFFLHVNTFCVLWVFHLRFFSAQFAHLSCTLEEVMDTQPWKWKSCMKLHLGAFFSAYISEFSQNIILSSTFATQALSTTDNNLRNNQLHLLKSLSLSKMKLIIGKEYSEPNRYLWLSSWMLWRLRGLPCHHRRICNHQSEPEQFQLKMKNATCTMCITQWNTVYLMLIVNVTHQLNN